MSVLKIIDTSPLLSDWSAEDHVGVSVLKAPSKSNSNATFQELFMQ